MPRFSTPHLLDGCTVPISTPLGADMRPDSAAIIPLLDALAASGVETIMLMGTNGEGALHDLSDAARFCVDAAAAWRQRLGERAKVFVTVFGAGTAHSLTVARALMAARPDAVVYAPPHYFVHTEDELADHFMAAAELGVPVIAYNIPKYTNNPITPALLNRIAAMDHIIGMKDSGGLETLTEQAIALQATYPRFAASQGTEKRLGWALMAGARGITPGLANLAPRLCAELVAAVSAGNIEEADRLQDRLSALTAIHGIRPGIAAMKASLSLLGLCPSRPCAPFRPYSPEELTRLHAILSTFDGELAAPLGEAPAA